MSDDVKVTPYANSVFEQPWWLDVVAPGKWRELSVSKNGEVVARWPIVTDGNKAFMPKETQTIGPWFAKVEGETEHDRLSRMQKAIQEMLQQAEISRWDYALAPECDYVLPFMRNGFQLHPRFTYVIDDLSDIEGVEARYAKTVKKNLKRASQVVEVKRVDDPDILIRSMRATFDAQHRSLPVSEELISQIVEESLRHSNGVLLAAFDDSGLCHSSSLFVYDEKRCYYLLSGSDPAVRTSGAQTLILRDGIRFAAEHSKVFDFEGSMIEGIEKFFRQFSGRQVVYYRITKQSLLMQMADLAKPRVKKLLHYK